MTELVDLAEKVLEFQPVRFSVAPMMDWTDRHCRSLHRVLSRRTLLYTEMVTSGAVVHGDRAKLLGYDPEQHPVALQLGGSDPAELAQAARIAEDYGYDEINLNVGCPSDRVQSGRFGACLMREPDLVAECMAAIKNAGENPGDGQVPDRGRRPGSGRGAVHPGRPFSAAAGVEGFVVHARKAWLKGLSPKENRDIPPLDYELVYRLKRERPNLTIAINGGVPGVDAALEHLANGVDGVMLGRAAYHEAGLLGQVDRRGVRHGCRRCRQLRGGRALQAVPGP